MFESSLGDWQGNVATWLRATTSSRHDSGGHEGLHDLVEHADKLAVESVAMCNIGITALCLSYLLKVRKLESTVNSR